MVWRLLADFIIKGTINLQNVYLSLIIEKLSFFYGETEDTFDFLHPTHRKQEL